MAINGKDCKCAAQHEGGCACGCDWTTPKEARLQEINAELLAACKAVVELSFENDAAYFEAWKLCEAAIASAKESEGVG